MHSNTNSGKGKSFSSKPPAQKSGNSKPGSHLSIASISGPSSMTRTKRNNTDHMIPLANRLLGLTARFTWKMIKGLAHVAVRIPGWFIRLNTSKVTAKEVPLKNKSPETTQGI